MLRYALILMALASFGCATEPERLWYHQTATAQDFYVVRAECSRVAGQAVPPGSAPRLPPPPVFGNGGYTPTAIDWGAASDHAMRNNVYRDCMYGRGWYLATREEAVRRDPDHLNTVSVGRFAGLCRESIAKCSDELELQLRRKSCWPESGMASEVATDFLRWLDAQEQSQDVSEVAPYGVHELFGCADPAAAE